MQHRGTARPTRFRVRHTSTRYRHVVAKSASLVTVAALGFGAVFAQATINQFQDSLNVRDISDLVGDAGMRDPAVLDPNDPLSGKDVNILLLGSDIRDGDNVKLGGAADVGGMRADATVLLHISADRTRVEAISFPRDMRVRIPDCETFDGTLIRGWTAKFNVAFANGGRYGDPAEGAACVIKTIYELTGIPIDHYVVLDFAGFRDMIDAVGGVPMCIPQRIDSPKARLTLEPGPQVLDGKTALGWVRARTGTGTGDGTDLARIGRQQELMRNLAEKVLGMNVLSDAGQLTNFAQATAESMFLDERLGSLTYMVGLGLSMVDFDTANLTFVTVPWQYAGDNSGDVLMVEHEARPIFDAIIADNPLPGSTAPDPTIDTLSATPFAADSDTEPASASSPATASLVPTDPDTAERPPKRIPHPDGEQPGQPLAPSLWEITEQVNRELLNAC